MDDMNRSKEGLAAELQQLKNENSELKMERAAIWDTFPIPFVIVRASDGQFIYGNFKVKELFGIGAPDSNFNSCLSRITVMKPDGSPFSPEGILSGYSFEYGKTIQNIELIIQNAKGIKRPVIVNSAPIFDKQGHLTESVVVFEDVTKYKLAEEGLKKVVMLAEKRSRELDGVIQALPAGLIIYDKNGNILDTNSYSEDYFEAHEIDREKTLSERVEQIQGYQLSGRRLRVEESPAYRALVNGETVKDFRLMTWNGSGSLVYTTWNCAPTRDNKGRIKGAVAIHKEITEEVRVETALRKSKRHALELVDKLRQSDQNKNTFINMLSHEIRNPLASAMLGIEMIEKMQQEGEWNTKVVEIVKRQLTQLSHMADDLLDVTHITEQNLVLKKQPVELNEIVEQVIEDYQWQFVYDGVVLKTEFTSPLHLDGDPVRLAQAVGNLLHNAVKFTERGKEVSVAVARSKDTDEALITVRDAGMGMDSEMLSDVFEPFSQADKSIDRRRGGLGLGLSIVKGIVELHGGSITAKSDGLGRGTEFIVRLPVTPRKETSAAEQEEASGESLRVLVIDDMPDITEIMTALLAHLGHDVVSASDGLEGIAKAKEFRPHVLFCDIGLPGMNGYEVAQYFCGDDDLKGTYMVAFSGYAQPEDRQRSRKAGFKEHLAKPVELNTLKKILTTCVQKMTASELPAS